MIETMIADISKGLSAQPKYLSSKYLYDARGDKIFQSIMNMPEYYLTNAEFEILNFSKKDILNSIEGTDDFDIIELGVGDGSKTKIILKEASNRNPKLNFFAIDISKNILKKLKEKFKKEIPGLKIETIAKDYFEGIQSLLKKSQKPKLVFFLGSNIGNMAYDEAIDFLKKFQNKLNKGDYLLIGFDLKKDPRLIKEAYDDPHQITKAFNLNLLTRINKELDANFDLSAFDFYCNYSPLSGRVDSYLLSTRKQNVEIKKCQQSFNFEHGELIHTEVSRKFDHTEIETLAKKTGFQVINHFHDCKEYFSDSLWRVK